MSGHPTRRPIRLMADYDCFPLWEDGDGEAGDIDPATLPITADLRNALADWASRYDATLNRDDPAESGFETTADEARFKADGEALARRLRDELGAGFEVRLHT